MEPKKRAMYTKIEDLEPNTHGQNLVVQIQKVDSMINKKKYDGSLVRIAEVLIGDDTGTIILTARNGSFVIEQVDMMEEEKYLVIRNCMIDVYDGFLRVTVGQWGKITEFPDYVASTPEPPTKINMENNMSDVEYELVPS